MYRKHYQKLLAKSFIRWSIAAYLQTLLKFLLLLVYDSEAEVDLIGLVKFGLHSHDLRKSLLCVLKRPIAIVQDTNAVP